MTESLDRLRAVARGQRGAFLREQAQNAGVPDAVLRGGINSGLLDRIGTRSVRGSLAPSAPLDDLAAMMLDIVPDGWVSHDAASALLGFEGFVLRGPFDILVPRGTYSVRPGLRLHTSAYRPLKDRVFVGSLPVTSPARTLIDISATTSPQRLTVLLDNALRDRLLTLDLLLGRIAELRTQGRYGIPRLLAVIDGVDAGRGGHSWLERRFLEITAAAGLPRPETQKVVGAVDGRLIRVDCRYPGTNVVVELLGYRWHRSRTQMSRDAERLNRMVLDGLFPLQFSFDQITLGPDRVLLTVAEALFPDTRMDTA
jgi:hypothetical protein